MSTHVTEYNGNPSIPPEAYSGHVLLNVFHKKLVLYLVVCCRKHNTDASPGMRTLPLACPRRSYLAPALSHMTRNSRSLHSSPPVSSQSNPLQPATTDSGFILGPSPLSNPFTSDLAFQRVLASYLPPATYSTITPHLTKFAEEAISPEVNDSIATAERQQPYVKQYDVFGRRYEVDRLVTSHGWKEVGKWGVRNGVIALGYEPEYGPYRRIVQHAHNFIYSASSAVYSCPVSMTSGASRLFQHQTRTLPPSHPFHIIYKHLIARENNWISAQWMTERPGGSDVQNSETVATYSPLPSKTGEHGTIEEGDYLVSGFKWFSSATDCDIALMLAKTETGKLSLFVAPTKLTVTVTVPETSDPSKRGTTKKVVTNGIRIHRLKTKMGTKELPTAELELRGVRAHLVGPLDRGIPTIATLLNVTRTHNFITALSCWRRSMGIAKSFAMARTTIDQPLWLFPMHLRLLATMEVRFRGLLQLAFFTTACLSFVDNGYPGSEGESGRGSGNGYTYAPLPEKDEVVVVLRALTATTKAVVCKTSNFGMQECQEAMGGVGYMDEPDEPEWNISRLMRDTAANMTWEGTTNVLASEVVRHLVKGRNLDLISRWLTRALDQIRDQDMRAALQEAWSVLEGKLRAERELGDVLAEGREIMFSFAWAMSGMLLAHDAQRDGDEIAEEVARRWVLDAEGGVGEFVLRDVVYRQGKRRASAVIDSGRANWDCRLAWGTDLPEGERVRGYREMKL